MTVSCHCSASSNGLQALLEAAADCKRLLIFTGSGLSATSGIFHKDICGGSMPIMEGTLCKEYWPGWGIQSSQTAHAAHLVSGDEHP